MEYVIPNLGKYGYVQPKSSSEWNTFKWFIFIVAVVSLIVYFLTQKEEKKENKEEPKPIPQPDTNNLSPFQAQPS